jgi:hypothetical protein
MKAKQELFICTASFSTLKMETAHFFKMSVASCPRRQTIFKKEQIYQSQIKVELSQCIIKHHAMEMYGGLEV